MTQQTSKSIFDNITNSVRTPSSYADGAESLRLRDPKLSKSFMNQEKKAYHRYKNQSLNLDLNHMHV